MALLVLALGTNLMLFGGVERRLTVFLRPGILLVVAGLGVEALALWRDRGTRSEPSGR
ncbi:hypothetical protein GCM10011578_027610 [Streptomyces fuscichromogenes]|uniref:Uncharacterized protein n=2 Tax=Streptomyces fuscichromogenes TaxID=1324013 RepID=A0A917XB90_9ACTN|nr:hypothetical protein GCM10011578_027610 [Streptomyces fuscichromogenes]